MFNTVWFYVLLYVVTGIIVCVVDTEIFRIVYNRLLGIGADCAEEFSEKTSIEAGSAILTAFLMIVVFTMWPISSVISAINRVIVYKRIIKEELNKKQEKELEIQERWTVR